MNIGDQIGRARSDLARLDDQIATKTAELAALQDERDQIAAGVDELESFQAWQADASVRAEFTAWKQTQSAVPALVAP